jgi:hypothetical protein
VAVAHGGTGASDASTARSNLGITDTTPGGSPTHVQYNNSGAFGGSANLTFDGTTLAVSADQYIANGKGLVVGNATAVGGSHGYEIQALGTGGLDAGVTMGNWAASAAGPVMSFIKSRNATIGSLGRVQDDDVLGSIYFIADDGTDFESRAAEIRANIDGAVESANDTPGRLTFYTAANGANAVTERMRITAAGLVGIGAVAPTAQLNVYKSGGGTADVVTNIAGSTSTGTFTNSFGNTSNRATLVVGTAYTSGEGILNLESAGNSRLFVTAAGMVGIGTTTKPSNLTSGLTIDTGSNDDDSIHFKSSDCNTPLTGVVGESDSWGSIRKYYGVHGGMYMTGVTDASAQGAMWIRGVTGSTYPDLTKGASQVAPVNIIAAQDNDSGGQGVMDTNANLVTIQDGGWPGTRFIFDKEGDCHYDGGTVANSWDDEDDIGLLSTFRNLTTGNQAQHVFGEFVQDNAQILHDTGVITMNDDGHHFVSTKGLNALIIDTIRQEGQKWREVIGGYRDKITALESRLMRLEN